MQRASRYLVALGSYRAHLTACLALFACLALADTAGAVPPVPADCDAVVDSGERIQCKYGNIVEQQLETAAMLANLPDLPQSQQQALMNQANRAENARSRASPIDFQQLTRKTESTCQVVELLIADMPVMGGDGDGICTMGETCSEVIGDGIGNDDGECSPRQGAKREVCVELCDAEALNSDENFDEAGIGGDVEGQLDEMTDQYVELNQLLDQEMPLLAAVQLLATNGSSCAALMANRTSSAALFRGFLIAEATLRGIADIAERGCDQSFFGTNGAAFCTVVEGVAMGAAITSAVFQSNELVIDSDTMDQTLDCLVEVKAAVGAVDGKVAASAGELSGLVADVAALKTTLDTEVVALKAQLAELMELLMIPEGQRLAVSNN